MTDNAPSRSVPARRDLAVAIATFGMTEGPRFPRAPLDAEAWGNLMTDVSSQRLLGLADAAITAGFPVTEPQATDVRRAAEAQAIDCLALDTMLVGLADEFDRVGIDFRVLKGPGVARRFYARIEWRPYGDIDLLVRPDQWDRAAAHLVELGCVRRFDEPRAGFTARFGKGASFVTPSNYEVDLHRTFVAGPHGLAFDPNLLFTSPVTFDVGGRTLPMLSDVHGAIHVGMHAILGSAAPRWIPLRDCIQIVRSGLEVDDLVSAAADLGARWPLALALRHAHRDLAIPIDSAIEQWGNDYRPTAREARAAEVYRSTDQRYSRQALAGLRAIPTWRARAEYAAALALPDPAYRRRREQSLVGRLRLSARLARRARP